MKCSEENLAFDHRLASYCAETDKDLGQHHDKEKVLAHAKCLWEASFKWCLDHLGHNMKIN